MVNKERVSSNCSVKQDTHLFYSSLDDTDTSLVMIGRQLEAAAILQTAGIEDLFVTLKSTWPNLFGLIGDIGGYFTYSNNKVQDHPAFFSGLSLDVNSFPQQRFVVGMTSIYNWGFTMVDANEYSSELVKATIAINKQPLYNLSQEIFTGTSLITPLFINGNIQIDPPNVERLGIATIDKVTDFFLNKFRTPEYFAA